MRRIPPSFGEPVVGLTVSEGFEADAAPAGGATGGAWGFAGWPQALPSATPNPAMRNLFSASRRVNRPVERFEMFRRPSRMACAPFSLSRTKEWRAPLRSGHAPLLSDACGDLPPPTTGAPRSVGRAHTGQRKLD